MVIARVWREGVVGSYFLMGIEFQFEKKKKKNSFKFEPDCVTHTKILKIRGFALGAIL